MRLRSRVKLAKVTNSEELFKLETAYRKYFKNEIIPFAKETPFVSLAEDVLPDKEGLWNHPVYMAMSHHQTQIGINRLCTKTKNFLEEKNKQGYPMDILSVTAGVDGDKILLMFLFRAYDEKPRFDPDLYDYLGEKEQKEERIERARLIAPKGSVHTITEEEKEAHTEKIKNQNEILSRSTEEQPFLNILDEYTPQKLYEIEPTAELIYDLMTRDMSISTNLPYPEFISIFRESIRYITSTEKDGYYGVLRGVEKKETYMNVVEAYINRTFIDTKRLPKEDMPALIKKIDNALFEMYVLQDLIDDDMITDIKVTSPDSIRVRVKGRAYSSNVTFIDMADYNRFIQGLSILNNIDLHEPSQTFTDMHDENYLLRFVLNAPYIMSEGCPTLHIRKVPRNKKMGKDLIEAGMFDIKIRDYLLDCGKFSRGIVFAGPPGSGKTTILNWFLEDAYETSAEILIIQENDELFAYRKGVIIQHVVMNPQKGEKKCTLEDLGKMALVSGANVFVIGEAKGAEICDAITLANSGCRTAITIHSESSTETVNKMADLAMRGYASTPEQAKRMLKSFQTIVYLSDFKVQEIAEITGFDESKKDMTYRMIYRRNADSSVY